MGASTGLFGTVRAQLHLRQVLSALGCYALAKPEVLLMQAQTRFDEQLTFIDERSRVLVRDLLVARIEWTQRVRRNPSTL